MKEHIALEWLKFSVEHTVADNIDEKKVRIWKLCSFYCNEQANVYWKIVLTIESYYQTGQTFLDAAVVNELSIPALRAFVTASLCCIYDTFDNNIKMK